MKTPFKIYLLIATTTMAVAWLLGALRFSYAWASQVFEILLFPFGWFYLLFEKMAGNDGVRTMLDDELGQGMLFLAMVLLQAYLIYLIYLGVRKFKHRKSHRNEKIHGY